MRSIISTHCKVNASFFFSTLVLRSTTFDPTGTVSKVLSLELIACPAQMTSENGDAAGPQTCPNYFYALRMNEWFRPDVLVGYQVFVKTDVSRTLGTHSTTTMLTKKLLLSTLYPHGFQFGVSFHGNPAVPGQPER